MRRQDDMGDVSAFGTWSLVIKQKGVYHMKLMINIEYLNNREKYSCVFY